MVDDLTAEQKKADADVEQVKARRARDRDRMDQGLITNPKDLERMQHELVSLERRITTLEDEELEVMEQLEEAQGDARRRCSDSWPRPTSGWPRWPPRATGRTAEIDAELASIAAERGPAVDGHARRPAGALRPAARAARAASAPPRCGPASAAAAGSPSTRSSSP